MKHNQTNSRSSKGRDAEKIACDYLKKNGLKLLETNFYSRYGEIDLIMQHKQTLVFIEVRYRKNIDYGGAKTSITPSKQSKVRKTALYYMQQQGREFNCRIDVVAISEINANSNDKHAKNALDIEWIQNAF